MTPLWTHTTTHTAGYREAQPSQLLEHTVERIIDVREPHEFAGELGHIPAAELAPLGQLETACAQWEATQEILVVCRSGARSARACLWLREQGFTRVINLAGGMINYNENERRVSLRSKAVS